MVIDIPFFTQDVIPALNQGLKVSIALIVPASILGFVGGVAYNKYYNFRKLPDCLAFFNGKRFVPLMVIIYSVVISVILSFCANAQFFFKISIC